MTSRRSAKAGSGDVLLVTDTRLDRQVVIKSILGEAAGNRMAVQRFLTEAKAITALNHANIVQIYDYGCAKDGPFLIMEYVDGGSLLDRCRESDLRLEQPIDLAGKRGRADPGNKFAAAPVADIAARKPGKKRPLKQPGISELSVRETHLFPVAYSADFPGVFVIRSGGGRVAGPGPAAMHGFPTDRPRGRPATGPTTRGDGERGQLAAARRVSG